MMDFKVAILPNHNLWQWSRVQKIKERKISLKFHTKKSFTAGKKINDVSSLLHCGEIPN
jgi:hypothetical protein